MSHYKQLDFTNAHYNIVHLWDNHFCILLHHYCQLHHWVTFTPLWSQITCVHYGSLNVTYCYSHFCTLVTRPLYFTCTHLCTLPQYTTKYHFYYIHLSSLLFGGAGPGGKGGGDVLLWVSILLCEFAECSCTLARCILYLQAPPFELAALPVGCTRYQWRASGWQVCIIYGIIYNVLCDQKWSKVILL